jgi:hypothetical protein
MPNINSKIRFSSFIENYKAKRKYKTLVETIVHIVEIRMFNYIDFDNINNYITDSLKQKLLIESSDNKLIVDAYKVNTSESLL